MTYRVVSKGKETVMKWIRTKITRYLIRLAMKTCVYGFTYDNLEAAHEWEGVDW